MLLILFNFELYSVTGCADIVKFCCSITKMLFTMLIINCSKICASQNRFLYALPKCMLCKKIMHYVSNTFVYQIFIMLLMLTWWHCECFYRAVNRWDSIFLLATCDILDNDFVYSGCYFKIIWQTLKVGNGCSL